MMNFKFNRELFSKPFFPYAIIILVWIISGIIVNLALDSSQKGVFGDSFGVVNSLFTGLAFSALIHSIKLQRIELKAQREELEMTRYELTRAAAAQELNLANQITQSRIDKMPYFNFAVNKIENISPNVSITNIGKYPALNVELIFINKYNRPSPLSIKNIFNRYLNDLYDLSDFESISFKRNIHNLPSRHGVHFELRNYVELKEYEVMIQYEDILGNNYNSFYIISMGATGKRRHELLSIKSRIPIPSNRIYFDNNVNNTILINDEYVNDFLLKWKKSTPEEGGLDYATISNLEIQYP